jgi:hypothetical protein
LAVYLALLWSELLARPSPSKTFVLLDEAQWFSHDTLAEMLRLARRRNVHVVLATQSVGSLPEGVDEAVWTNVSDFVVFRGSPAEARELERATGGLSMEEILALPRGHAAVLLGKGHSVSWLRTAGRPPNIPRSEPDSEASPPEREGPSHVSETDGKWESATADDVLHWIREKARAEPGAPCLRVELAELRRTIDPVGKAIREAGAVLGRAGALRSSLRNQSGVVWTVDIAKLPADPSAPVGEPGSADAGAPQPS